MVLISISPSLRIRTPATRKPRLLVGIFFAVFGAAIGIRRATRQAVDAAAQHVIAGLHAAGAVEAINRVCPFRIHAAVSILGNLRIVFL